MVIIFVLGWIAFVLLLMLYVAAVSHHCDGCGEKLVRWTGNRWRCPDCGRIYNIGMLVLGRERQMACGSKDDKKLDKEVPVKEETPDMIYLLPDERCPCGYSPYWVELPYRTGAVQYVRADVFVEMTSEWMKKNCMGYWMDDSALSNRDLIEEYKKYMYVNR